MDLERRLKLHEKLSSFVQFAYFQPPSNVSMRYPCIRYNLDDIDVNFADNLPYRHVKRYRVIVIDSDPDTEISNQVAKMPMCTFSAHYVADDLHHFVYNLYF